MTALLELSDVTIVTPAGRPLFDGMSLRLGRERVALVGRNGVGKSTLLAVLAGDAEPHAGRVRARSRPRYVPQAVGSLPEWIRAMALSHGERRKLALLDAARSGADILLLDEPTEDLDDASVSWLRGWLREWPGCLVVASHDRRLLEDFEHFFVASESGCRYFSGTMLGRRAPAIGSVFRDPAKIGSIAQGATDWILDDTLLWCLHREARRSRRKTRRSSSWPTSSRSRSETVRSAR